METIINSSFVVKAYQTPDKKFLKVENKNGAVYTIWSNKYGDFQVTQPIEPNVKTGSSLHTLGEGDIYEPLETVMELLKNGHRQIPNFFSLEDIQATQFLTIEEAVNIHGNILQYNKIK